MFPSQIQIPHLDKRDGLTPYAGQPKVDLLS